MSNSRLPGFYKLSLEDRIQRLREEGVLDEATARALVEPVELETLDELSENVVGRFSLPVGLATNFTIDGEDVLVPMATEETSVVAAASHGAKLAREHGGFTTRGADPVMIGQVHLVDVDAREAKARVDEAREDLLEAIGDPQSSMQARGGGPRAIETHLRRLDDDREILAVHVLADVRDAMGANYVNGLAEELAPRLAELTGGRPLLRILSNLATRRRVTAEATFDADALGGPRVVEDIVTANEIARADPYRATTHNKGLLNGITAVVLATGNDTRAVEASAHAYAARDRRYGPLTTYEQTEEGHLLGRLEVPIPVGTVGGATVVHPQARAVLSILGVTSSTDLAKVAASVGLAQNLAALRALVAEGIQEGHMSLHAVNLARQAGVPGELVDAVAETMVERGEVSQTAAREIARERGADL